MAAALTQNGLHVGFEPRQKLHGHKGLYGAGKAAAVDADCTLAAQQMFCGGGFAGTVQAFVPVEMLAEFKAGMEAILGEGRCHVLSIRPEGGAVL